MATDSTIDLNDAQDIWALKANMLAYALAQGGQPEALTKPIFAQRNTPRQFQWGASEAALLEQIGNQSGGTWWVKANGYSQPTDAAVCGILYGLSHSSQGDGWPKLLGKDPSLGYYRTYFDAFSALSCNPQGGGPAGLVIPTTDVATDMPPVHHVPGVTPPPPASDPGFLPAGIEESTFCDSYPYPVKQFEFATGASIAALLETMSWTLTAGQAPSG